MTSFPKERMRSISFFFKQRYAKLISSQNVLDLSMKKRFVGNNKNAEI